MRQLSGEYAALLVGKLPGDRESDIDREDDRRGEGRKRGMRRRFPGGEEWERGKEGKEWKKESGALLNLPPGAQGS